MNTLLNWARRTVPPRWREKVHGALNCSRALVLPEPYRTVLPYTMVGLKRLRNLDRLAHAVDERRLPGDVVECGTCNGGSAAVLARIACHSPLSRHVWLLDSFAGMPPAGEKDSPLASDYTGLCCGKIQRVREVLRLVEVPQETVTIVPGWFEDTLPSLAVQRIALLHIDADWHDSVLLCLEHLFDRVVPGGFVVFDDYGYWEGCRLAWREFKDRRGLNLEVTDIDGVGAYFQKTATAADESESPTASVLGR
jgi:O-methyltransferase